MEMNSFETCFQAALGHRENFFWDRPLNTSPGFILLVHMGEQPNTTSYPESCAGGFSPRQSKLWFVATSLFPRSQAPKLPPKVGWGHHPSQSNLWSGQHPPWHPPSIHSQRRRWKDEDLQPYQCAIRAPLCSALFDFPVTVSGGEQAGQHLGLRGPVLAVPFPAVSVGFGAGASSRTPAGSALAASQSEDSPEQLSQRREGLDIWVWGHMSPGRANATVAFTLIWVKSLLEIRSGL